MSDKQYPIGGYAPGNYHNRCVTCERSFFGDKRAVQCEPCAMKDKEAFDALSPEEQQEVLKRNGEIAAKLCAESHPFESAGVNYLKFEKAARKFWQMFYGKEFPYKFSEWFWEKRNAFSSGLGVKSAVWVKACERLPDKGGIDNKVIVRGVLNEQGYANHFFVAYGFRNFSKEKQEMYFEYGSKSFLTNDLEWLDESAGASAVWVKGQYDQLYEQVKSGKRTVCYIDYHAHGVDKVYRDICTIRPDVLEFSSRGVGYGCAQYMDGDEKTNFIQFCEKMNVEWLRESPSLAPDQAGKDEAATVLEWVFNNRRTIVHMESAAQLYDIYQSKNK